MKVLQGYMGGCANLAACGGRSGTSNASGGHATAMKAFVKRLHWHCRFMQKFKDQPGLENVDMHSERAGLRPLAPDLELFAAWKHGQTGDPLVGACMRSVQQTGWMNFRTRAMVVSFASYPFVVGLGTHQSLARMFTDLGAGIQRRARSVSGKTG